MLSALVSFTLESLTIQNGQLLVAQLNSFIQLIETARSLSLSNELCLGGSARARLRHYNSGRGWLVKSYSDRTLARRASRRYLNFCFLSLCRYRGYTVMETRSTRSNATALWNQPCSEDHLAVISVAIADWRAVSPFLGQKLRRLLY